MNTPMLSPSEVRDGELSVHFVASPEVAAVALGESQSSGVVDSESDLNLYVYTTADIPLFSIELN